MACPGCWCCPCISASWAFTYASQTALEDQLFFRNLKCKNLDERLRGGQLKVCDLLFLFFSEGVGVDGGSKSDLLKTQVQNKICKTAAAHIHLTNNSLKTLCLLSKS